MTIGFDEIQLHKAGKACMVTLVVKEKLSKEDYEAFVPQLDWHIKKNGTINLMIELKDFKGWTVGALWEDTKFALKHFVDIRKLAVVGDGGPWEKGITIFTKPFTMAKVRFFESTEKQTAWKWLSSA